MDPTGTIYPCLTLDHPIGNIREREFDELWEGAEGAAARAAASRCRQPCWMICSARTAMLRRPQEPAAWILRSWFKLAAGKRIA